MQNFFSENLPFSITLISSLFGIIAVHRLFIHRNNRIMAVEAADKFRESILNELEGIYPQSRSWPRDINSILIKTIPKIEKHAEEFKIHIKRKKAFTKAVKAYRQKCYSTKWESVAAYIIFDKSREPGELAPDLEFIKSVEKMLSFTKI